MNNRIFIWMIAVITAWTLNLSEVYNDIRSEPITEMIVKQGNNITLECKIPNDKDCPWKKKGQPVTIDGRYIYLNKSSEIETKDCSIQIIQFQIELDIGLWECRPMITDTLEYNTTKFYAAYQLITENTTSNISYNDPDKSKPSNLIYIGVSIGVVALASFVITCYCIFRKRNRQGDNPHSSTVKEYDTNETSNDVSASLNVDMNNSFVSDKQLITIRKPMPYPRNLLVEKTKRTSRSMGCLMEGSYGARLNGADQGADLRTHSSIPLLNSPVQYANDYSPDQNLYDDVINAKYPNPYEVIPIRHGKPQEAPLHGDTPTDQRMLPPKPPIKASEVIYSEVVVSSKTRNKDKPEIPSSDPDN